MAKTLLPKVKSFKISKAAGSWPNQDVKAGFPTKKPQSWTGSLAEYYVKIVLERLKADFQYEGYIGLPNSQGSIQIDFKVYSPTVVAIRVQGEYWHYAEGSAQMAYDYLHRIQTEAAGWPVVDIDANDALKDPTYYVKEALNLRSHSKFIKRI